jgi:hypothetical protein
MLWSCEGLIRLAMVLRHLNAILTFVFPNMFVTLRICGEMKVNVTHIYFCSCLCVLWCALFYVLSGVLDLYYCRWETVLLGYVKNC